MPILPTAVERLLFFRLNRAPGPLLDLFGAVGFRVVVSAIKLKVFDTLQPGPLSAGELARAFAAERGIAMLMDTLAALGYVSQTSGRYANTARNSRPSRRPMPSGSLGRRPLAVVSADTAWWAAGAPADATRQVYAQPNIEQAALSSNSIHRVVAGASHTSLVNDRAHAEVWG
jgi:hypothetical protein